ncbi:MAG: hypothetical protein HY851_00160 [candidate division Zixibacteria bacterium]|nr:hypothetical protein [candidate division Zixibacteria bacterium]
MKTHTLIGTVALTALLATTGQAASLTYTQPEPAPVVDVVQISGSTTQFHSGPRSYDAETGLVLTPDLAERLASSRARNQNCWAKNIASGNPLPFTSTPFLTGALLGGGSYAVSTKSFRVDRLVGYAVIGGLSRIVSSKVARHSAVASSAIGSILYNAGGGILEGKAQRVDLGFATVGEKGIQAKNPLTIGGLLGWLTVAEDLGKLLHTGHTFEKVKARQLREGRPRIGEPDLRFAEQESIVKATERISPDEQYQGKSADDKGRTILRDAVTGKDISLASHNFGDLRLGGHLHADPRHGLNVWHYDFYGSGHRNLLTAIHHIAFESLPCDLAAKGVFKLRLPRHITYAPYQVYRSQYFFFQAESGNDDLPVRSSPTQRYRERSTVL